MRSLRSGVRKFLINRKANKLRESFEKKGYVDVAGSRYSQIEGPKTLSRIASDVYKDSRRKLKNSRISNVELVERIVPAPSKLVGIAARPVVWASKGVKHLGRAMDKADLRDAVALKYAARKLKKKRTIDVKPTRVIIE